jgi:hypothetical protein
VFEANTYKDLIQNYEDYHSVMAKELNANTSFNLNEVFK